MIKDKRIDSIRTIRYFAWIFCNFKKYFSLLLNLKICYYALHETNNEEIVGRGVIVGKVYHGSGSGDYRFSGDNLQL